MSLGTIVPTGTNIASNVSPSLVAANGALAVDSTTPGLYYGNSNIWYPVSSGNALKLTGVTLSLSGQPSLTNCTLFIDKITVGTNTIKVFLLDINQTITVSANGNWLSTNTTIPAAYAPSAPSGTYTQTGTCVFNNTVSGQTVSYWFIIPSGSTASIGFYQPASSGNISMDSISGIYM